MTPATVVRCDDSLTGDDGMTDLLAMYSRGDLKAMDRKYRLGYQNAPRPHWLTEAALFNMRMTVTDDSVMHSLVGCSHDDLWIALRYCLPNRK